jgi:hypothetical protein
MLQGNIPFYTQQIPTCVQITAGMSPKGTHLNLDFVVQNGTLETSHNKFPLRYY